MDSLIHSLEAQDLPALCASMGNVLEVVTIPAYPVIQGIREQMMQCGGALQAMMSGSGPTVFGIFRQLCPEQKRPVPVFGEEGWRNRYF